MPHIGKVASRIFALPEYERAQSYLFHSAVRHLMKSPSAASQAELTKRIIAADGARNSNDPAGIAIANKRLIASALRAIGRLRLQESLAAQSAELYRVSLQFEDLPEAHAELARSSVIAGQDDDAIREAQQALAADPANAGTWLTLGRAFSDKQEFTKV